jgi:hypothetical protein
VGGGLGRVMEWSSRWLSRQRDGVVKWVVVKAEGLHGLVGGGLGCGVARSSGWLSWQRDGVVKWVVV